MCLGVPPAPVYKGAGEGAAGQEEGAPGGVLLPPGVGFPPFPSPCRRRRKERRGRRKVGGAAPSLVQFGLAMGAGASTPCGPPLLSTKAHEGPILPRGVPVTSRYSKNTRITPEPFRCPNITFQYINLYLLTISRLLVMSVISYGTPNKLRSQKHITHNTNRHRTLSVRTLRVRELCRHDRDASPIDNQ